MRAAATRYKGIITLWEIWNEPDLASFYCGSPDRLISLTQRAGRLLKSIDPANRILSPGFSGYIGPGYLDYFLAHGGRDAVDIISYHFYVDIPEQGLGQRTANVHAAIARNGAQNKPLWNTEQGWINGLSAPLPATTGAAFLARAYLVSWASGLGRYCYYLWGTDRIVPTVQPDNITLAPAGQAYQQIARWMTGAVMTSLIVTPGGTYLVTLRPARGSDLRVVWNPTRTSRIAIPAVWKATTSTDLSGRSTPLAGATIVTVTGSPILLRSALSPAAPAARETAPPG